MLIINVGNNVPESRARILFLASLPFEESCLFLISLLFVALLDPFNSYSPFNFLCTITVVF